MGGGGEGWGRRPDPGLLVPDASRQEAEANFLAQGSAESGSGQERGVARQASSSNCASSFSAPGAGFAAETNKKMNWKSTN